MNLKNVSIKRFILILLFGSFPENSDVLVEGIPKGEREYLLYLPLYNGITSVEIGIPMESKIKKHLPEQASQLFFMVLPSPREDALPGLECVPLLYLAGGLI